MTTERIKRFAAAFVGDPEASKHALYGVRSGIPRFSEEWCIVPGLDMLLDLEIILRGDPLQEAWQTGLSLLMPDSPLDYRSPVARHLYAVSQDFCERLANLTEARIQEIATHWHRLLRPTASVDALPEPSEGKAQHREKILRSLMELAVAAIRRSHRLMLYVEHRRADRP
jgi:hypothetical protein